MSAPDPTPAPELKTLGRYNIERTLGKGAMGVVYEGIDPKLNRRVAIKTILKSHLDPDTAKDYSMRFSREAQAVARLNHPHIVQVYDFAEEGDVAYLVMEFIRGKELKNFFDANERFDIKEAVRIMCELLDALDFAHNAGIIHRDIKPANVMLDAQARTKLTDFGVARVQDSDRTQAERTQAGTMVGTPAYMSPEQITGGTIDKRSDVFSAGIILYQFLTGEKPFTGGGAWTIAKKIIQEDPPAPSSLNNAVTPFFDAVVNKALSKNAETRYQSAKDFGVALRRALEGRGEEEDADKTIVGEMSAPPSMRTAPQPRPAAAVGGGTHSGTQSATQAGNQEIELEFWRAIKDGTDPDDFELYVQQFPTGIYAALAKRKIAKLRGAATDDETSAESKKQERKEAEEAARKEAEARAKLADEKEKLELELAKKEEEFRQREAQREAEAKARAEAAEKAQQEAAAERERAKQEADRAKQEAAAELAKREAEYKKREAEAGEKAKQEAEKARKESEAAVKKQAEERAKREAEFKKREAELKAQAAAGGKKTSPALLAGVAIAVLALAGTGYYFFAPNEAAQRQQIAEMQKQLEAAKQQAAELEKAKKREEEGRLALERARQAEAEAKKSGDKAKEKELAEARARAEAEQRKMADTTKAREAEAKRSADAARLAQEKASASDRQADQKVAAERAASDKAAAARLAQEKAAAEKAALERAAAAEKAAQERIAAAEKAAADAAVRAAAAEKAAAEKTKLAAAAPGGSEALFEQAAALEQQGKGNDAVKLYVRSARSGNGKAAKRLGDIFDKGLAGVSRDYAESLKWYNAARVLGEEVPLQKSR
ncbi:MAG TPA: protein kinase [Burkholderiales bacterium]|nr:protein kinase [Burkholderiales bacterium]